VAVIVFPSKVLQADLSAGGVAPVAAGINALHLPSSDVEISIALGWIVVNILAAPNEILGHQHDMYGGRCHVLQPAPAF